MKKINLMVRKCKSLSSQLGRSSSCSSLTSKSTRDHEISWGDHRQEGNDNCETIFVGSTRKRYVIDSKYLNHPLLNALSEKSSEKQGEFILVKCEVVLFDHLLWMLDNAGPNHISESLEELADLHAL